MADKHPKKATKPISRGLKLPCLGPQYSGPRKPKNGNLTPDMGSTHRHITGIFSQLVPIWGQSGENTRFYELVAKNPYLGRLPGPFSIYSFLRERTDGH